MNERKTKGLTNLNSDEKIIRETCVSLVRMYFSQFAAISCLSNEGTKDTPIAPVSVVSMNSISSYIDFCLYYAMHYSDVTMSTMASQISGVLIVCSTVFLGAEQRKHQSFASLASVRGIHRWPMETWKMFPFDDVIMEQYHLLSHVMI